MKVAFSVALLATLALAYSVFLHDSENCLLFGNKECNVTADTQLVSAVKSCASSCCSKKEMVVALSEPGSCCSQKSSCCSTEVACQDGECESKCSSEKSCCQKTEFVSTQDGECDSSCSTGKKCCMEKTQTVSTQDGECDSSCSTGKSCCMEKTQTVSTQDGECDSACSSKKECCASKGEMVNKQDGDCGKCPASCQTVAADKDCDQCPVATALAKLPKMTYRVGEESTCCSGTATEMAEKSEAAIHYVVADRVFECKNEAYVALVEKTEAFVDGFLAPVKCEHSGKTSVAGESFGCCEAAGKRTELVVNAVKDLRVSYKVNEESACCKNAAESLAKEHSAPIHYVVGEETTPCELNARMKLAHAKYTAAVKAIAAADMASAETATEVSEAETASKG